MDLEELKTDLVKVARNLLNLRVTTAVGGMTLEIKDDRLVATALPADAPSMTTNINLIEGDIWTTVSQEMVNGDLKDMRTYHEGMVERADTIIGRNIEIVKDVINKLATM